MSVASPVALPKLPTDDLVLVSVLGEGGTSVVYRAWMVEAGQWCAVKVLKGKRSGRVERRFLTEARLLCALTHRNLVKGYAVGEGDPPWFVMEIADGGSLKDWCARFGKMPPRLAVDVAIQVCKGVSIAHQAGYVHRDIKPHNVLVNRRGVCKLTDFGIARVARPSLEEVEDPSGAGDALGTLGYMAPEQQSDPSGVDARSDVYGLGATLVHLLTGSPPPGNLFMAAKEHPELFAGIPGELVTVLQKATAYRREDRHVTVMELAKELHATWEFLAVADGPTLTTGIPLEPPPPHGMTSRTPVSIPSNPGAPSIPPSDPLAPSLPVDVQSLLEALTPPPSALRHQYDPEPPPPERTRWWLVAVIVATQVFALFCLDVYWVGRPRQESLVFHDRFTQAAQRNVAVIEELGRLGADRDLLSAGYGKTRAGTVLERRDASVAWVRDLHAAAEAHPGDERVGQVVAARVTELDAALGPWTTAVDRWHTRSTRFPGTLVTGLVGRPDTEAGGDR
jgi:serine/threonine protein kinase